MRVPVLTDVWNYPQDPLHPHASVIWCEEENLLYWLLAGGLRMSDAGWIICLWEQWILLVVYQYQPYCSTGAE